MATSERRLVDRLAGHAGAAPAQRDWWELVRSRDLRLVIGLGGVGLVLLLGLPTLIVPLATDQAYFALGGRTLLDGGRLYVDFWDIKPPLIYLTYAVPMAIGDGRVEGFRALDLVSTAIAMLAVFYLARRFFTERAGVIAAGSYGLAYLADAGFDGLGQTESFMAAPIAAAFALYRVDDHDPRAARAAFVSGLLIGAAAAFKFSAVGFVLGWPAAELLLSDGTRRTMRGVAQRLFWAVAGFVAVQAAWVVYLAASGSLSAFVDIQWRYTVPYHAFRWSPEEFSYPRFLIHATTDWFRSTLYLLIPALSAVFFALYRGPRPSVTFLFGLAALGVASVYWQGKMFRYHWLIMLPLLAPLAGYVIDQAITLFGRLPRRESVAAFALLILGFAFLAAEPLLATYDGYQLLAKRVSGSVTQREVEEVHLSELSLNRELSDYVWANGEAGDSLYVWGFWPVPYLWADGDLATRFVVNAGLRSTWAPDAWRQELVDDLTTMPPRFIAVAAGDRQPWLVGTAQTSAEHFCNDFHGLRRFVEERYEPVLSNEVFVLYDRQASEQQAVSVCCRQGREGGVVHSGASCPARVSR